MRFIKAGITASSARKPASADIMVRWNGEKRRCVVIEADGIVERFQHGRETELHWNVEAAIQAVTREKSDIVDAEGAEMKLQDQPVIDGHPCHFLRHPGVERPGIGK